MSSATAMTQQCFPQQPIQPVRSMPIDQSSGLDITASSSQLPVYCTEFTLESLLAFQSPADAASFSYGVACVPPISETSGFALNIINESGLDLSNNMNSLEPGQGPVFEAAGHGHTGWNASQSDTRLPPSYGLASYRDILQTQANGTQAVTPFLADLETPTVNPALVLSSIPYGYGSNTSTRMTSFSVTPPGSLLSDGTLFGDSDTFTGSSGLCIATPRASTRESSQSLPDMGLGGGKVRQSSRVPKALHAVSPERKATEESASAQLTDSRNSRTQNPNAEPAEASGEILRLGRKRKHDLISPIALTVEKTGLKRNLKDRLPHSKEVVSHIGELPVALPKRKPGRPLSTSSTARAIVRDLAELHAGPNNKDLHSQLDFSRAAFDHTLPPFPEVSVYVGERIVDISLPAIAEEEEEDAAYGDDTALGEAGERPTRSNRVTAKKHRELIKERTKNLEDVKAWMDQALPEYERRNRKLLETIGRLRKENEALLAQVDHPDSASK